MGEQKPSVGRVAHYVARGSLDGKFPPACRAALITEVGGWHTVQEHTSTRRGDQYWSLPIPHGARTRDLTQYWDDTQCGLAVLNPTGQFFHDAEFDEGVAAEVPTDLCTGRHHAPGSWHFPTIVR